MDYEANVNAVVQGYMNGQAGNSLDTTGVMMDLPKARNFTQSFSRHQDLVGQKIRETVMKEMDIALKMEIKATIVHKESEEFYETWLKTDKGKRKKIGLAVS